MEPTAEQLAPYLAIAEPLESLRYANTLSIGAWNEIARVLLEESASPEHARAIVREFVRTQRFDDDGKRRDDVPTSIELRMFARTVPEQPIERGVLPDPCDECGPIGGTHRLIEKNGVTVAARCLCKRGEELARRSAAAASVHRG